MKQQIFIIAGAVLVLLLVGVWAYLMFFGTPKTVTGVFSDLGLSGEEDNFIPLEETPVVDTDTINMSRPKLRQLSIREVAGYVEVNTGTTSNDVIVNYAEAGTGHIYSINTTSGEEKRISGTTVMQADRAYFSPDGQYVAMTKNSNTKESELVLGKLSTSSDLTVTSFSEKVHDFSLKNNTELLYSKYQNQNLVGYSYNFASGVIKNIFTIPFNDAKIIWGEKAASSHYVYPRATNYLEGYLYEINNDALTRMPVAGFGLTVNLNDDFIIYTKAEQNSTSGFIYNRKTAEVDPLQSAVIPEKCFLPTTGLEMLCAQEPKIAPRDFIDSWYKGETTFQDSLWLISADYLTSELVVDTFSVSSRKLDIVNLVVGDSKTAVYFINKNDNSLWMYEL